MSEATAITWSGKSEAMFEIMLGEVPEAMRGMFRGKLSAVIVQKTQGGPALEDHVTAVVTEIVPEPFKSNILKKFRELGDFDIKIIDQIIEKNGTSQDKLMYILHDIQDEVGYLPVEALRAVSNKTGINLSTIYNVATFYKTFKLTRPGNHHVKICCGTACHLNDKNGFARQIEDRVNASPAVSIEKTLCMGCCDCSPAVEIDGRIYKGDEAKAKIATLA
ncbi:MAG: NAD(P)H-dependent oxidoreductase subunit E [Proteobacteria bacterium]|nr:NAD(P)H-dependent oxidoreductase subunit E [Pseudomonadota bacterium]